MRRIYGLVIAIGVALIACGKNDAGEAPPPGSTPSPRTEAPAAAPPAAPAAPKPAADPQRDGYCRMTISGGISDHAEHVGGGTMGFGSDLWQDAPWDKLPFKTTLFTLNCGASDDPWFVALAAAPNAKPADIPYGPHKYVVVHSKPQPGQMVMVIGARHGDFEVEFAGKKQTTHMMGIGLAGEGTLEVTRFDDGGVAGTFHLPATVAPVLAEHDTPIVIDAEFAYPCTLSSDKCRTSRGD